MKLVELLAKEMSVWPEEASMAGQDYDREIRFYDADKDQISFLDFYVDDRADDACDEITFAGGGVRVIKAQWQAERDRQKGGEWKRHRGGKCPVSADTQVEVKHYDGEVMIRYAHQQDWAHDKPHSPGDIMKYRVISQPQAEGVEVGSDKKWYEPEEAPDTRGHKGPFPCAPEGEPLNQLEWDIQFPSGVCSVQAKTEQMETPFKWRDEVTELNAYIEKYTRERDALIERLASEGFALIPPVVSVVSEFSGVDMSDWNNWQVGDVIKVISNTGGHEFAIGTEVTVITVDTFDRSYRIEATAGGNDWWLAKDDGEFIRRP